MQNAFFMSPFVIFCSILSRLILELLRTTANIVLNSLTMRKKDGNTVKMIMGTKKQFLSDLQKDYVVHCAKNVLSAFKICDDI